MNIRTDLTCPKCGSNSLIEDEEKDAPREGGVRYFLKCLACSRSFRYNPHTLPLPKLPDDGERYVGKSLSTISAEQRYRRSELYRTTRIKHDRTYRQSPHGSAQIKKRKQERRGEERIRLGVLRRLIERGLM